MRILSPRIAFKNNLIHDEAGLIKYRNKLDLYEKYESGDLTIWVNNNLPIKISDDGYKEIGNYYNFISKLDNEISYINENEDFQQLLKTLRFKEKNNLKSILMTIKSIVLKYELLFYQLHKSYKEELINTNLNVFIGFAIIINKFSNEISTDFLINIKNILSEGFKGEDNQSDLEVHLADDFTKKIEINNMFMIVECSGPLTLTNFNPAYQTESFSETENTFLDVYSRESTQKIINKIYSPQTNITLKDSTAFAEYIEVKYDDL